MFRATLCLSSGG